MDKTEFMKHCWQDHSTRKLRDFVSVEDVVEVNMHFLDHPKQSGIFNLGNSQAQSFNDVAVATIDTLRNAEGKTASELSNSSTRFDYLHTAPGPAEREKPKLYASRRQCVT